MFSMVLFSDDKLTMHLNWFGLGALTVVDADGGKRRAHPVQKRYLQELARELKELGVSISPKDPVCTSALGDIAHLIYDYSPDSTVWHVATALSPKEAAEGYVNAARSA